MNPETPQQPRDYSAPVVTNLGSLRDMTFGSKFHSTADIQSGQPTVNGPGS